MVFEVSTAISQGWRREVEEEKQRGRSACKFSFFLFVTIGLSFFCHLYLLELQDFNPTLPWPFFHSFLIILGSFNLFLHRCAIQS